MTTVYDEGPFRQWAAIHFGGEFVLSEMLVLIDTDFQDELGYFYNYELFSSEPGAENVIVSGSTLELYTGTTLRQTLPLTSQFALQRLICGQLTTAGHVDSVFQAFEPAAGPFATHGVDPQDITRLRVMSEGSPVVDEPVVAHCFRNASISGFTVSIEQHHRW